MTTKVKVTNPFLSEINDYSLNEGPEKILEKIEYGGNLNGFYNTNNPRERSPTFQRAPAEIVLPRTLKRGMNSAIVFGKDRMGDLTHGNGGKGLAGSNAIDIVVGFASSYRRRGKSLDIDTVVGKNPYTDAARVYISQRTDIEKYFGLPPSKFSGASISEERSDLKGSGAVVKADHVYLLGRKTIKIRAGIADGKNLPRKGEPDADGREIDSFINRIELIGAPGEELFGVPKGEKLTEYLTKVSNNQKNLKAAIMEINARLMALSIDLAQHIHVGANGPVAPSFELVRSAMEDGPLAIYNISKDFRDALQIILDEINYLDPTKNSIVSKNVFTT